MAHEESDFERGRATGQRDAGLRQMRGDIDLLTKRVEGVEKSNVQLTQEFGEFVAVARAMAEKAVTNRSFAVGVAVVIVAIIALFLGQHP